MFEIYDEKSREEYFDELIADCVVIYGKVNGEWKTFTPEEYKETINMRCDFQNSMKEPNRSL